MQADVDVNDPLVPDRHRPHLSRWHGSVHPPPHSPHPTGPAHSLLSMGDSDQFPSTAPADSAVPMDTRPEPSSSTLPQPRALQQQDAPQQRGRLPSLAQGFGFAETGVSSTPSQERHADPLPSNNLSTYTLTSGPSSRRPSRPPSLTRQALRSDLPSTNLSPRSSISGPSTAVAGPISAPAIPAWGSQLPSLPSRRASAYDVGSSPRRGSAHDEPREPLLRLPSLSAAVPLRPYPPSLRTSPPPLTNDPEGEGQSDPARRMSYAATYTSPLAPNRYSLVGRYARSSLSGPTPETWRTSMHDVAPYPTPSAPTHLAPRASPPPHVSRPTSPMAMGFSSPGQDSLPVRPTMHWRGSAPQISTLSSTAQPLYPNASAPGFPPAPTQAAPDASGWVQNYPNLPPGAMPSVAGPPPPRMPPATAPGTNQAGGPPRPFQCHHCGAAFVRNHDLRRHCRIHLSTKPFACPECHKPFSRKDALNRHILVKGCAGRKRRREFRIDADDGRRASVDTSVGVRPRSDEGSNEGVSKLDVPGANAQARETRTLPTLAVHRHSWAPTAVPASLSGMMPPCDVSSPAEYTPPRRLSAARNSFPTDVLSSALDARTTRLPGLNAPGDDGPSASLAFTDNSRTSSALSSSSVAESVRTDPYSQHSHARSSITALSSHGQHEDYVHPSAPPSAPPSGPTLRWTKSYAVPPAPSSPRPDQRTVLPPLNSQGKRASLVHFADPWVPPQ